jgi:hypothetical protein
MLHDLLVDLIVEFAVVAEDGVHLLQLFNDEAVFVDERFDCYAPAHEHLVH